MNLLDKDYICFMKKWIAILLTPFVLFSCSDSSNETDRDKIGLFGNVQKLVERTSRANVVEDKWAEVNVLSTNEFFYNKEGYVTEWIYEVPAYRYTEHYKYTDKGNPISVFISDPMDTATSHCKVKLNDDGEILEEIWYDKHGDMEFRYLNTYNKDGQISETKAFNDEDSLRTIRKFTYNDKGLQDTVFSYSPENELQQYTVKEFEGKWLKSSYSYVPKLDLENDLGIINTSVFVDKDKEGNWVKAHMTTINKHKKDTVYRILDRDVIYYVD